MSDSAGGTGAANDATVSLTGVPSDDPEARARRIEGARDKVKRAKAALAEAEAELAAAQKKAT